MSIRLFTAVNPFDAIEYPDMVPSWIRFDNAEIEWHFGEYLATLDNAHRELWLAEALLSLFYVGTYAIAAVYLLDKPRNAAVLVAYATYAGIVDCSNGPTILRSDELERLLGRSLVVPVSGIPYVEINSCQKKMVKLM